MNQENRIKRIAFFALIAVPLLIYSIHTDGWSLTLAPFRIFLVGGVSLVTLFKYLGWM